MRAADVLMSPWWSRPTRHRRPHWDDHIVGRLLAPCIDPELAEGTSSRSTVAHAARAAQLIGRRSRHSLARSLELLVEGAEQPELSGRRRAIPPCLEQVRDALPEIRMICAWLRSAEPIDARGVAMLHALLDDNEGPCYARSHTAALTEALQEVLRWLHVMS